MSDVDERSENGAAVVGLVFTTIAAAIGVGFLVKNYGDRKTSTWLERLARDKCPWCLANIERPEDGDPEWQCTKKPSVHNEKRKWEFYLR
ncbi:MAG: hypothetical protein WC804_08955 [Sphingomonas sp.]|jgi:hypothetical protein|uniref:hypothetical protein n=1 Tax=Sphingomonas sp. TaxID=28214 RepID=UPI003569A2E5